MIIDEVICHLIKNCHGRLEVFIDDPKTDEYIGFDQHNRLTYALYKTLERYYKHNKESHGDEEYEKTFNNLDCQNNLQKNMEPIHRPNKNEKHTNRKPQEKKQTSSNGS